MFQNEREITIMPSCHILIHFSLLSNTKNFLYCLLTFDPYENISTDTKLAFICIFQSYSIDDVLIRVYSTLCPLQSIDKFM